MGVCAVSAEGLTTRDAPPFAIIGGGIRVTRGIRSGCGVRSNECQTPAVCARVTLSMSACVHARQGVSDDHKSGATGRVRHRARDGKGVCKSARQHYPFTPQRQLSHTLPAAYLHSPFPKHSRRFPIPPSPSSVISTPAFSLFAPSPHLSPFPLLPLSPPTASSPPPHSDLQDARLTGDLPAAVFDLTALRLLSVPPPAPSSSSHPLEPPSPRRPAVPTRSRHLHVARWVPDSHKGSQIVTKGPQEASRVLESHAHITPSIRLPHTARITQPAATALLHTHPTANRSPSHSPSHSPPLASPCHSSCAPRAPPGSNLALNPKLTGSLPDALGNLAHLTLLDVHGCNLTGSIPSTVGRLASLRFFLANQNGLSGSIPSTVSAMQRLYMWDIMDNRIEGVVPSFVGANELGHLHMSRNLLTSVPAHISRLPKLEHVLVDSNRLTHPIPAAFNNTNLTVIYWSNNVLPSLPSTWFLPRLKDFLVSNCSLPSQLLPSFPLSAGLANLDLSSNSFTGAIPPTLFWNNPNLINLNLANNMLTGHLPQQIANTSRLQSLFLADNNLTGAIPDMAGLPSLVALSLYDNDFTAVPPALLNHTNVTLQLYGNDLCKPFRAEIVQQCSPPRPLTQYTASAICPELACASDLFRPSQPLFRDASECVCVSPLRAELGLYLTDLVVFSADLVEGLEDKLFSQLTTRAHINITRYQVQVTGISSRASLASLASTFASDHTTHESTLIITALFFPPAGDDSWLPSDTPRAIRAALSTRDPLLRANLDEFGSYRVEAFYGPAPYKPPEQASSALGPGAIAAIAICCATLVIALVLVLLFRPWEKRGWSSADYSLLEGISLQHARRYSLQQLHDATHGFDDHRVLGQGGFGKVYHGELNGEAVAIKKATEKHRHDGADFKNEIELLTAVSHGNLVKLTGFCVEKDEQLLVFEFMEGGALDAWIKGKMSRMLTWRERMHIALNAASALHYLHREMRPAIVHHDIKPANILLTAALEAKVADFGISKSMPERGELVPDEIVGSKGYIDPYFVHSGVLTESSDVYSFGVVLLQLATGQPALIQHVPLSQVVLHLAFGPQGLSSVVDPRLHNALLAAAAAADGSNASAAAAAAGVVAGGAGEWEEGGVSAREMVAGLEETFSTFLRIALWCTTEHPTLRPDMEQVVSELRSIRDQLGAGMAGGGSSSRSPRGTPSGFTTPSSFHGSLPPLDASAFSSPSVTEEQSMSGTQEYTWSGYSAAQGPASHPSYPPATSAAGGGGGGEASPGTHRQQAAQQQQGAARGAGGLAPLWGPGLVAGVHPPPSSAAQGDAAMGRGYAGGVPGAAGGVTDEEQGHTETITGPRAR
ncbi:unnamed protein product [Closterium sp. Naga37s-1]|nr:unnamed protein product [Closterium sp. Naga37s-1]